MGRIKHKSFTLIELIIAVGIVGLLLPAVFSIFFAIIRQQLVLVAYQTMKQQGDSVQRNIKNILQNRAAYITDSTYDFASSPEACPLITTPTPTQSPDLYIKDRDEISIHLYSDINPTPPTVAVASDSAGVIPKTYRLTSQDVTITDLTFTCSRINDFTPPIVKTSYTVLKSAVFQDKDISLLYSFSTRLRNY